MSDLPDLAADLIRDTLTDLVAQRGGGFVTGFSLLAELVDADGERGWLFAQHPDQAPTTTIGQLRFATICAETDLNEYLTAEGDE